MPAAHLKMFAVETQAKILNTRERLKWQILFSSEWPRNKSSEKFDPFFLKLLLLAKIFKNKRYIIIVKNKKIYPTTIHKLNYSYYRVIYKIHGNYIDYRPDSTYQMSYLFQHFYLPSKSSTHCLNFFFGWMTVVVESPPETSHAIFRRMLLQCELPQERACTSKVTEIISRDDDFIFNWLEHIRIVASYILIPKVQSLTHLQQFYTQKVLMRSMSGFVFSIEIKKKIHIHIPSRIFSNYFPTLFLPRGVTNYFSFVLSRQVTWITAITSGMQEEIRHREHDLIRPCFY